MTEEKKKDILDECIIKDSDIYVSLKMLENFADGVIGQMRTTHMLAAAVANMCDEMYIKAGLREPEKNDEDGRDDGNSSNA